MVRRAPDPFPSHEPPRLDELPDVDASKMPYVRRHKQLNVSVHRDDFALIRDEAIRRGTTVAGLVKQWIAPHLEQLREKSS